MLCFIMATGSIELVVCEGVCGRGREGGEVKGMFIGREPLFGGWLK